MVQLVYNATRELLSSADNKSLIANNLDIEGRNVITRRWFDSRFRSRAAAS